MSNAFKPRPPGSRLLRMETPREDSLNDAVAKNDMEHALASRMAQTAAAASFASASAKQPEPSARPLGEAPLQCPLFDFGVDASKVLSLLERANNLNEAGENKSESRRSMCPLVMHLDTAHDVSHLLSKKVVDTKKLVQVFLCLVYSTLARKQPVSPPRAIGVHESVVAELLSRVRFLFAGARSVNQPNPLYAVALLPSRVMHADRVDIDGALVYKEWQTVSVSKDQLRVDFAKGLNLGELPVLNTKTNPFLREMKCLGEFLRMIANAKPDEVHAFDGGLCYYFLAAAAFSAEFWHGKPLGAVFASMREQSGKCSAQEVCNAFLVKQGSHLSSYLVLIKADAMKEMVFACGRYIAPHLENPGKMPEDDTAPLLGRSRVDLFVLGSNGSVCPVGRHVALSRFYKHVKEVLISNAPVALPLERLIRKTGFWLKLREAADPEARGGLYFTPEGKEYMALDEEDLRLDLAKNLLMIVTHDPWNKSVEAPWQEYLGQMVCKRNEQSLNLERAILENNTRALKILVSDKSSMTSAAYSKPPHVRPADIQREAEGHTALGRVSDDPTQVGRHALYEESGEYELKDEYDWAKPRVSSKRKFKEPSKRPKKKLRASDNASATAVASGLGSAAAPMPSTSQEQSGSAGEGVASSDAPAASASASGAPTPSAPASASDASDPDWEFQSMY
jgi:hypothetical protein